MLRTFKTSRLASGACWILAFAGCGTQSTPSPPATGTDASATSNEPPSATGSAILNPANDRQANASSGSATSTSQRPNTTPVPTGPPLSFDEQITRDMLQAAARESQGDFAAALKQWESVVERLITKHGAESWQVRTAEVAQAQSRRRSEFDFSARQKLVEIADLERRGDRFTLDQDPQSALQSYVAALELAAEVWGDASHVTLGIRRKVAARQEQTGDFESAMASYLAVLNGRDQLFGSDHPYTIDQLGDLARFHQHLGRYELAIQHAADRLNRCQAVFGNNTAETAEAINDLGTIYYDARDYAQASSHLESAVAMRRQVLGVDDPSVAHALRNLALVRIAQSQTAEAEVMLTEAIGILSELDDASVIAELKMHRGTCRLTQQNLNGAEEDFRQAVDTLAPLQSTNPLSFASACFKHGYVLGRLGRYPEAKPLLDQALQIQRQSLPTNDPTLIKTEEIAALVQSKLDSARFTDQGTTLR